MPAFWIFAIGLGLGITLGMVVTYPEVLRLRAHHDGTHRCGDDTCTEDHGERAGVTS